MASILAVDEAIRRAGAKLRPDGGPSAPPATPAQAAAVTTPGAGTGPRVSMGVATSQGKALVQTECDQRVAKRGCR